MTTITNFLNTNFLNPASLATSNSNNDTKSQQETPIWVINGTRDKKINILKHYMIDNCITYSKALIVVDVGLSNLMTIRDCLKKIQIDKGIFVSVMQENKPYYIITLSSDLRKNTKECIAIIIKTLNTFPTILKNFNIPLTTSGFSLILQNLQTIATQKQSKTHLEEFINQLASLNSSIFKQISIFKYGDILLPEHEFALERLSTCLTDIQQYNPVSLSWLVKSTVRRHTGFSNQERYQIKIAKNGKIKVEKWVPKQQQYNQAQKQLVNQLGFVVKKGESGIQQNMRKMIYPHLRMQDTQCGCVKIGCGCKQNKTSDEGLIILDDEQQDEDDIDV